jgi:ATP-dependent RNA helicase SUPV3L1/SUV3
LFENNGVIKREEVNEIIKKIPKESRINLRRSGIKLGRYHIFLPKMLKPNAVNLRTKLWNLYFQSNKKNFIPKFGLNFLENDNIYDKRFLLLCGFENFENFYIRIDILERLFIKIIEKAKDGVFKVESDMVNLVGCNNENFYKLLKLMQYKQKVIKNDKELSFIYQPKYTKNKKIKNSRGAKEKSPFHKLTEMKFR